MSMTSDAANIALCNNALDLLGAERITVLDITDQNHIYCTGQFDQSRDEILENHKWNWAKKRAYALETTSPLFGYDNAFTYPTDCLKVWMIDQDPSAKFEVEGGLILTDEGDTPQAWATATAYKVGEYVSTTPVVWATGTAYIDGQYVTSGTLIYEILTDHTSGVLATDITNSKIISKGTGSKGTYYVAVAHTSDTVLIDVAAGNLTPSSGDLAILEVEYVYQSTAVSSYPAYLYQCCVLNLAIKVGPAIKQNEKAALNLQAMLYGSKNVTGYLDIARSIDAQEQGGVVIKTSDLLNSRY